MPGTVEIVAVDAHGVLWYPPLYPFYNYVSWYVRQLDRYLVVWLIFWGNADSNIAIGVVEITLYEAQ